MIHQTLATLSNEKNAFLTTELNTEREHFSEQLKIMMDTNTDAFEGLLEHTQTSIGEHEKEIRHTLSKRLEAIRSEFSRLRIEEDERICHHYEEILRSLALEKMALSDETRMTELQLKDIELLKASESQIMMGHPSLDSCNEECERNRRLVEDANIRALTLKNFRESSRRIETEIANIKNESNECSAKLKTIA